MTTTTQRPAPDSEFRMESNIRRDALAALQTWLPFSSATIRLVVADGEVTLEGCVDWNYCRCRAEQAVREVAGVRAVANMIELRPRVSVADVKHAIETAARPLPPDHP